MPWLQGSDYHGGSIQVVDLVTGARRCIRTRIKRSCVGRMISCSMHTEGFGLQTLARPDDATWTEVLCATPGRMAVSVVKSFAPW